MRDALGNVQSALVLGGTSEIALAIVDGLARGGRLRRVVLAGRDPAGLEGAATHLRAAGVADVAATAFDAADIESHPGVIEAAFGGDDIDVVLVAFGVLGDQDAFDRDPVAAGRAVVVNHAGAVSATLAAAQHLRRQGHGTIVVLSSVAGQRARKANFVYGASKAGLDAFAQGLGDRLAGTGVDVMIVRPGFVHTKMTAGMEPAPMSVDAGAVAGAVCAGLARRRAVVWVPAKLRFVFAVFRLLPRAVWRRMPR